MTCTIIGTSFLRSAVAARSSRTFQLLPLRPVIVLSSLSASKYSTRQHCISSRSYALVQEERKQPTEQLFKNRTLQPCNCPTFYLIQSASTNLLVSNKVESDAAQKRFLYHDRRLFSNSPNVSSTASMIKELRERTGAPMMECKKALKEVHDVKDGVDIMEAALEWLRTHGSAKLSSKLEGRALGQEGMVGLRISDDCRKASLVEMSSETDFASRSKEFAQLLETLTLRALDEVPGETGESEAAAALSSKNLELIDQAKLAIRENLQINSVHRLNGDDVGVWSGYVHNRSPHSNNVGSSAALVKLCSVSDSGEGSLSTEQIQTIGKQLAMHIVAAKPSFLSTAKVPENIVEREKEVLKQQMVQAGGKQPPAEKLDMILKGKLQKLFFSQSCLEEQEHMVLPDNPNIGKFLKQKGLKVADFKLIAIGGK